VGVEKPMPETLMATPSVPLSAAPQGKMARISTGSPGEVRTTWRLAAARADVVRLGNRRVMAVRGKIARSEPRISEPSGAKCADTRRYWRAVSPVSSWMVATAPMMERCVAKMAP